MHRVHRQLRFLLLYRLTHPQCQRPNRLHRHTDWPGNHGSEQPRHLGGNPVGKISIDRPDWRLAGRKRRSLGAESRTIAALLFTLALETMTVGDQALRTLGQVAFWARSTDDTQGIFVSDRAVIPEARSGVMCVSGLIVGFLSRRASQGQEC